MPVAVAVIDNQMELTRRQVVFYSVDQARMACAFAAWRPEMHHALSILAAQPMLTVMAERWRTEWVSALVHCWHRDMAGANQHIATANKLRDSLWIATT